MNKKELFILSIGVFFTVIAWLLADIYHVSSQEKIKIKVTLPKVQNYEIKKEVFLQLKEKQP